jgi:GNAT superfamily N-acetyltransferase
VGDLTLCGGCFTAVVEHPCEDHLFAVPGVLVSTAPSLLEPLGTLPRARVDDDGAATRPGALRDGLTLRALTVEDREALVRTVARCSSDTRYARFHTAVPVLTPGWARAMCQPAGKRVAVGVVVESAGHRLADEPGVSLGSPCGDEIVALAQVEPEVDGSAELAVLVEDAYHRTGLGAMLVRAALTEAARNGLRSVRAHVLPDNDAIRQLLLSLDLPVKRGYDDGKICWTIEIAGLVAA